MALKAVAVRVLNLLALTATRDLRSNVISECQVTFACPAFGKVDTNYDKRLGLDASSIAKGDAPWRNTVERHPSLGKIGLTGPKGLVNEPETSGCKMYECAQKNNYTLKSWRADHELNPRDQNEAALDWVFVADTLNFSFWSDDESHKYCIKYKGREYTGYWSWCAALNRALDNGVRITDASFYADIDEKKLAEILKSDSDVPIPLLEQRVDVLREAGKVLMEKYDGKFSNCIKACNKSAQSLMQLVVRDFPSYRDEAEYQRKRVSIYKRAQILVADIWACFEGTRFGEFLDIDTITMFADYRIPQALYHFGALSYSDELMEYLKAGNMMKSGDRYEVEIRGCSIWATELVAERANELIKKDPSLKDVVMNSILIDHYLWDFRRDHAEEMRDNIPFHRIRCIYY